MVQNYTKIPNYTPTYKKITATCAENAVIQPFDSYP